MKMAILMLVSAYLYLGLRVLEVFPHHSHSGVYFAAWMGILTTVNLIREWRDYRRES